MNPQNVLKKYYERIAKESIIKSVLWGLSIGFFALLICSFLCWYFWFKGVWLYILVFVVTSAVATILLYFKKFKPTTKQVARRTDALGLEERIVTMTEFEADSSPITEIQRKDAKKVLSNVNEKLLKLVVSVGLIVTVCVFALCSTGMTVVALTSKISGKKVIEEALTPDPIFFEVSYETEGEGFVDGEQYQLVESGKDSTLVVATADDEWVFSGWSDGYGNPERYDINVLEDINVIAIFIEAEGAGGDGAGGDGGGEEGEGEGDGQGEGEGGGEDGEGNNKPTSDDNAGMSGVYEENNQVIDGQTYYGGSTFEAAREEVNERLNDDDQLPQEPKDIIDDYFDAIAK